MKVLVLCSGGFSSSLLVEKMKKLAQSRGEAMEVQATGTEALEDLIDDFDIVLVAPQVRHRFERLSEIAQSHHRPIGLIAPQDFGTANAEKVLENLKQFRQEKTEV